MDVEGDRPGGKATLSSRRMVWSEWFALAALIGAAISLLIFGGVITSALLALAALMSWSRVMERAAAENIAKGRPTVTSRGRAFIVLGLLLGAVAFFPRSIRDVEVREGGGAKEQAIVCPPGAKETSVDFVVDREGVFYAEPNEQSTVVTKAMGDEIVEVSLEAGSTVQQLCEMEDWSRVRVLTTPPEFQQFGGWVLKSSLREVPVTATGRRLYKVSDFEWPVGSKQSRAALVTVMNSIMRDNPACEALDVGNLVANRVNNQTVYSIPCWAKGELRSFDFTPADAKSGRSFVPVQPISKIDGIEACKSAILSRASHPSTVEFPTFDYDQRDGGDGNTRLLMSFTARNGFNLELEYDAKCYFRGRDLTDVVISEAEG